MATYHSRVRVDGAREGDITVPDGQAGDAPQAKTRIVNGVLQFNQGTTDAPNWTNTVDGDQNQ